MLIKSNTSKLNEYVRSTTMKSCAIADSVKQHLAAHNTLKTSNIRRHLQSATHGDILNIPTNRLREDLSDNHFK